MSCLLPLVHNRLGCDVGTFPNISVEDAPLAENLIQYRGGIVMSGNVISKKFLQRKGTSLAGKSFFFCILKEIHCKAVSSLL